MSRSLDPPDPKWPACVLRMWPPSARDLEKLVARPASRCPSRTDDATLDLLALDGQAMNPSQRERARPYSRGDRHGTKSVDRASETSYATHIGADSLRVPMDSSGRPVLRVSRWT